MARDMDGDYNCFTQFGDVYEMLGHKYVTEILSAVEKSIFLQIYNC